MAHSKGKGGKTAYGIIGLGRFGRALALELAAAGAELLVLDQDEEKVRELRDVTENAFVVPRLDRKSLEASGIQNCEVAVVCIAEHMDTSILTTLNLVSMGIPKVISKAASAEHGLILEKLGAEVVYPERDMAVRLANRLETARVLDLIELSETLNISKMRLPAPAVGMTVRDLNPRGRFGLNIIAIEHDGAVQEAITADYCFAEGDVLIVSGSKEGMRRLDDWGNKEEKR